MYGARVRVVWLVSRWNRCMCKLVCWPQACLHSAIHKNTSVSMHTKKQADYVQRVVMQLLSKKFCLSELSVLLFAEPSGEISSAEHVFSFVFCNSHQITLQEFSFIHNLCFGGTLKSGLRKIAVVVRAKEKIGQQLQPKHDTSRLLYTKLRVPLHKL